MSEYIDPVARKRAIIEDAKRRAAQQVEKIEYIPAEQATNKLRIICDNSGSMSGTVQTESKMEHAKKGIIEFLRNCTPNKDAVAIHLLNGYYRWNMNGEDENYLIDKSIVDSTLQTDLVNLALNIDSPNLSPTGGTPLYARIREAQEAMPKATRYIAFSDGEPNNFYDEEIVISEAKKNETPIDIVYIGLKDEKGFEIIKRLADRTNGIFLHYDPTKTVSFKDLFKYLSPAKRLMLMNEEFKRKLESGEIKA